MSSLLAVGFVTSTCSKRIVHNLVVTPESIVSIDRRLPSSSVILSVFPNEADSPISSDIASDFPATSILLGSGFVTFHCVQSLSHTYVVIIICRHAPQLLMPRLLLFYSHVHLTFLKAASYHCFALVFFFLSLSRLSEIFVTFGFFFHDLIPRPFD